VLASFQSLLAEEPLDSANAAKYLKAENREVDRNGSRRFESLN